MCTIDPLMCWYYDHEKFWQAHPEELEVMRKLMFTRDLQDEAAFYAKFRLLMEREGKDVVVRTEAQ